MFSDKISDTGTEGDEENGCVIESTTELSSDKRSDTGTEGDEESDCVIESTTELSFDKRSDTGTEGGGESDFVPESNGHEKSTMELLSDITSVSGTEGDKESDSVTNSNGDEEINSVIQRVEWENGLQTMFQPDEIKWSRSLAEYFYGRPRSMGRVINSFNVSRSIVNATLDDVPSPFFYRKMLKLILIAEIWSYRTSWLLQVAEDTLQQRKLECNTDHTPVENTLS